MFRDAASLYMSQQREWGDMQQGDVPAVVVVAINV